MPPIVNTVFEFSSFGLGAAVLVKLWSQPNKFHLFGFFFAMLMTAVVELFGVREMSSYHYGEFWWYIYQINPSFVIKLGGTGRDFPLFVAVDWAVIMFCFWRLGERLILKWYFKPFVFGLIAVAVDMALDPVASTSLEVLRPGLSCLDSTLPVPPIHANGIGYWVWCVASKANASEFWLGVPLANSYGWFLVVYVFTSFYFVAHQNAYLKPAVWQIAALLGAVIGSLVVFFTLLRWLLWLNLGFAGWYLLAGLLLAGVIALASAGMNRSAYTFDWSALTSLISSVLLCVGLFIFVGIGSPLLIGVVVLMLAVSTLLTLWVMLGKRLLGLPYP